MSDYAEIKSLIKDGISLQNDIKQFFRGELEAQDCGIVEALVEAIAEAAGMVAVTEDDLPKKEE